MVRSIASPTRRYAAAAIVAAVLLSRPEAQTIHRFFVLPGASLQSGMTAYDLRASTESGEGIRSRLEFPQDGPAATLKFGYARGKPEFDDLEVSVDLSSRIASPSGLLRDYDWIDDAGALPIPFSYSESSVSGKELAAALIVRRRAEGSFFPGLYLQAGYAFRFMEQTAEGYDGWQFALNTDGQPVGQAIDMASEEDAMIYRLWSHTLLLGAAVRIPMAPRLVLETAASYAPVYLSDYDDHLLRQKRSTAQGFGHGFRGSAELVWRPLRMGAMIRPRLSIATTLETFTVSTAQTQRTYGEAGSSELSGIGHEVSSARLLFSVAAGIEIFP